jgi:ERCC4-related helicase
MGNPFPPLSSSIQKLAAIVKEISAVTRQTAMIAATADEQPCMRRSHAQRNITQKTQSTHAFAVHNTCNEAQNYMSMISHLETDAVETAIDALEDIATSRAKATNDKLLELLLKAKRPEVYARPKATTNQTVTVNMPTLEELKAKKV